MIIRHVTSFVNNLVHSGEHMWTARIRVAYFLQIPSRGLRRRKRRRRRRRLENPQERNNGRLFRKLFSADCRDSSSLSRTKTGDERGRGGVKKKAKIGVQTKSREEGWRARGGKGGGGYGGRGGRGTLRLFSLDIRLPHPAGLSVALNRRIFDRHQFSLLKDWDPLSHLAGFRFRCYIDTCKNDTTYVSIMEIRWLTQGPCF